MTYVIGIWFGVAIFGIIVAAIVGLFPRKDNYNNSLCLSCQHLEKYDPKDDVWKYECRIGALDPMHRFNHTPEYCKNYVKRKGTFR